MSKRPPLHPVWQVPPALLAGDRRVVARAISQIEHGELAPGVVSNALRSHLGRAHVLGITGAPGAGKSTLVHAMLGELLARGRRIAVVAVDPSSPVSGGAVLGDRVRMGEHGAHANVFIRSLATRGHLGGLSSSTEEIVDVLDAAGFDVIIIETVGAGQSEVEIMRVADTRIVACPPGLGDSVQAIKAGILEIADLLVVTSRICRAPTARCAISRTCCICAPDPPPARGPFRCSAPAPKRAPMWPRCSTVPKITSSPPVAPGV